jgi:hypothetical protein
MHDGQRPRGAVSAEVRLRSLGPGRARFTNHDLVKESVTLHWYAALD